MTINPKSTDAVKAIMDITEFGADVSVEVAGVPATLMQATLSTRAVTSCRFAPRRAGA